MFTARNARASACAVVCATAVMLALTGCKIRPARRRAGGGSAVDRRGNGGSGSARSGPLIIEPGAGFSPVYSLINGARHSIDVTMYEFADTTAEHDLAAAAKRGVQVHVILDEREKSLNSSAYSYFRSHGIKVVWSSSRFTYTHQKTLVIDGSKGRHHDRQPDQQVLLDLPRFPRHRHQPGRRRRHHGGVRRRLRPPGRHPGDGRRPGLVADRLAGQTARR